MHFYFVIWNVAYFLLYNSLSYQNVFFKLNQQKINSFTLNLLFFESINWNVKYNNFTLLHAW